MASPYWNNGKGKYYPVGYSENRKDNNETFNFCDVMDGKDLEFRSGMLLSRVTQDFR